MSYVKSNYATLAKLITGKMDGATYCDLMALFGKHASESFNDGMKQGRDIMKNMGWNRRMCVRCETMVLEENMIGAYCDRCYNEEERFDETDK